VKTFEFTIEGPGVSINAKSNNARRYRNWVEAVAAAAKELWATNEKPITGPVEVRIYNYYTVPLIDVDNIIKSILDALKNVVYNDDSQVFRVISEKIDLAFDTRVSVPSDLLAAALEKYSELIHVVVEWQEE
jgi:Holliday junction resolvase RusA-like endonuclease